MSEIKTLKFPGDTEPREIVDAKAREDISKLSEEKANLPLAEDGTINAGISGQYATSDGKGGFNWKDGPTTLPNPNAITFTGAVTGSYDGSAPLEVEIPSGGGASGDYIPIPASAEVGQTIVVKAVDENGKPTEWEAADISCELIASETLTESAATVEFTGLNLGVGSYTIIIRNTGKLTGAGLSISLNGITKSGYTGSFYDGNGITSANISVLGSYTLCMGCMSNGGKNEYMWDSVTLPITSISVFSPYHPTDETKYFSAGTIVEIYRGVINYNM